MENRPGQYRPEPEKASQPEATQPPPESQEHQPLPGVWDIFERRAQLYETRRRDLVPHKHKHSREYLALYDEHREKVIQLGDEVASLYAEWTGRDRRIFDLYSASVEWRLGLSAQKTQQFIAKVQLMSEDELREELHTAREALERKTARYKKMVDTQHLNRTLTFEERDRLEKEKQRARSRAYQRRKKENRLQAEHQQLTQVFPPPTKA